jgi:hypothetical protein
MEFLFPLLTAEEGKETPREGKGGEPGEELNTIRGR